MPLKSSSNIEAKKSAPTTRSSGIKKTAPVSSAGIRKSSVSTKEVPKISKTKKTATKKRSTVKTLDESKTEKAAKETQRVMSNSEVKKSTKGKSVIMKEAGAFKALKTSQDTIPFRKAFKNGMIESAPNFFTKTYQLEDVNFRAAPQEEQETVFELYEKFINSFDANTIFQITINNKNIDEQTLQNEFLCKYKPDGLNYLRTELNDIILAKMEEGKNNLVSDKYLTVGITAEDKKAASTAFVTRIDREVDSQMKNMLSRQTSKTKPMTIEERTKCLHDIYNLGNEIQLPEDFDITDYTEQGIGIKDIIAPSFFKFREDHFRMGDTYGRVMFLKSFPTELSTDFMAEISELPFNLTASIHFQPIEKNAAEKLVKRHSTSINGNVKEAQQQASKEGYDISLISQDLLDSQQQATFLREDVKKNNQRLFLATIVIAHYADSYEKLKEDTKMLVSLGNRYGCGINKLNYQQEIGFATALPLGLNKIAVKRLLKTESAALFIPFDSQEIRQKDGLYYGVNALSRNLLMLNRASKSAKNPNGLILGQPGAGKSMTAKIEILNVLLTMEDNNKIFVIDPEREYVRMAEALAELGGSVIHIRPGSNIYINPFDMDISYGETEEGAENPLVMKSDYICSLCEVAMQSRYGLSNKQRSVIDRCVKILYKPYIEHIESLKGKITIDIHSSPTFDMFYELLMQQPDEEAHDIALAIEMFAKGSFDCFARETNVDVNAKFVVYDISEIGSNIKEMGLQVCLNHIWNETISNKKKGIRTWIYIDEFHIVAKSEAASGFVMQIWKRARKWNGVPCAITQNLEDLLKTESSRAIINNCEFIIMLCQSSIDREGLQNMLKISNTQIKYITNSSPGHGLIYNSQTIVPFENEIPEDTEIFKLISTKPITKSA